MTTEPNPDEPRDTEMDSAAKDAAEQARDEEEAAQKAAEARHVTECKAASRGETCSPTCPDFRRLCWQEYARRGIAPPSVKETKPPEHRLHDHAITVRTMNRGTRPVTIHAEWGGRNWDGTVFPGHEREWLVLPGHGDLRVDLDDDHSKPELNVTIQNPSNQAAYFLAWWGTQPLEVTLAPWTTYAWTLFDSGPFRIDDGTSGSIRLISVKVNGVLVMEQALLTEQTVPTEEERDDRPTDPPSSLDSPSTIDALNEPKFGERRPTLFMRALSWMLDRAIRHHMRD